MMYGLDHLGIAKYGKLAFQEHPAGFALGAFSNVFGDALPAVKAILDSGRCPRVRAHLYWSFNAGHKPDPDYLKRIQVEAIRVGKFYKSYVGRIDCRVSGFCEHPLNVSQAEKVRQIVMEYMPLGVTYVNCPQSNGAVLPNCVNELHKGANRNVTGRVDFSYDGVSVHDSDVSNDKIKYALAETFYLWIYQFNGHMSGSDRLPINQRKAYPDSNQIDACIYSSQDISGSNIPKGWTLKPVSDQHSTPYAGKDQKPVWILPLTKKYRMIEVRANNGQVINQAPYYGTANDENSGKITGYRYYHSEWGYLLCQKLKRIQGTIKGGLFADGKRLGDVVLCARLGSFR